MQHLHRHFAVETGVHPSIDDRHTAPPDLIEQFAAYKEHYEDETGAELDDEFTVSKPEAKKAKRKLKGKVKLDTGAVLNFSSAFIDKSDSLLERGFDAGKGMNFVKIYFSEEL